MEPIISTKSTASGLSFFGDAPLVDKDKDEFKRWPFAERIAQTIVARNDPSTIVIGIYGSWGEGKTTVLNFIEIALKDHVETIRFNPWRFGTETELLFSFFAALADALGRSLKKKREKIGEALAKYATLVSPVASSASPFMGPIGDVAEGTSELAKNLGTALSAVDIDKYRKRIEDYLKQSGKKIVIFMDDIDRLDRVEVQAVFRLVKLTADFPNITYVLAFDDKMVAAALSERYGARDENAGRDFLEKIIQVPLHLPRARKASLMKLCMNGVREALRVADIDLDDSAMYSFYREFDSGFSFRLTTPRLAKRYCNALVFALPLLKGEVNVVDLMLLEGIRVFYPNLYLWVARSRAESSRFTFEVTVSTSSSSETKGKIPDEVMRDLGPAEKKAVEVLLRFLFPRKADTAYGQERYETWYQEQRIASPRYFNRYFAYGIPDDDVPDQAVSGFIKSISALGVEETVPRLVEFLEGVDAQLVLQKMTPYIRSMGPEQATTSALSVAKCGVQLCQSTTGERDASVLHTAANLVSDVARSVPEPPRFAFLRQLIEQAEPTYLAVLIMIDIRNYARRDEIGTVVESQQERDLKVLLAARIRDLAQKEPLHLREPDVAMYLFSAWVAGTSKKETSDYLAERLKQNPKEALDLLRAYATPAIGTSDKPFKSDLQEESCQKLQRAFDPADIYAALRAVYGPEMDVEELPRVGLGTSNPDLVRAQQFSYWHRSRLDQSENRVQA